MKQAIEIIDNLADDGRFDFVRDEVYFDVTIPYGKLKAVGIVNAYTHRASGDAVFNYSISFAGEYFNSPITGFVVFSSDKPQDVDVMSNEINNYLRKQYNVEN